MGLSSPNTLQNIEFERCELLGLEPPELALARLKRRQVGSTSSSGGGKQQRGNSGSYCNW